LNSQISVLDTQFWTVSELNRYIRQMFENDPLLKDVWLQGEISNLARPNSGHIYFTIKDRQSSLKAVMWRSSAQRLRIQIQDGMSVEIHGSMGVYEAGGQYQLYADLIRPMGEGALFRQFMMLKEKLEAEGLFDPQRKRPIPAFPHRIGVVTSQTGAALRDILHTIQRRYPLVEIILAPTAVQGEEAPPGIIAALHALNSYAKPDVIILARGGGSIEDLWAFNDEGVARAIAASFTPVISGIGHETDFTIADFVSDLRAPTPTAAAEHAVPNRLDLIVTLNDTHQRLLRARQSAQIKHRERLAHLATRLTLRSPLSRLNTERQRLDEWQHRCQQSISHHIRFSRSYLSGISNNLENLNPKAVLGRGYAILRREDGSVLRNARQAELDENLSIQMIDGKFSARVTHPVQEAPNG
jgi:exodeoxyribonuclease VII large subunit